MLLKSLFLFIFLLSSSIGGIGSGSAFLVTKPSTTNRFIFNIPSHSGHGPSLPRSLPAQIQRILSSADSGQRVTPTSFGRSLPEFPQEGILLRVSEQSPGSSGHNSGERNICRFNHTLLLVSSKHPPASRSHKQTVFNDSDNRSIESS